ncbi:2-amino-4-hydroxy-6-hydroxymethyldihydropteridine diphosphokinase [Aliiroseovarius sp. PTFE2010]|uniref:2-amino-4-hydroxy-6- hydroxymethyldihydropteridine diphosphokinase n=1 Tax=Aliiroseovarius sp. PTFE2010 TaxID=3417190 RepID=UPI003CF601E4
MEQPVSDHNAEYRGIVALGGNIDSGFGPPNATITAAIDRLEASGVRVRARSNLYRTDCYPKGSGPDFINAVVAVETGLDAPALLALLHRIEAEFGRQRTARWSARTLDMDLIALGGQVLPDAATVRAWIDLPLAQQMERAPDGLILPHPRLQDRAFVLIPLCDVAPDWRHPISGLTAREMCDRLPQADKEGVKPV